MDLSQPFHPLVQFGITAAMFALGFLIGRIRTCIHPWELVDKTEVPSFFEQLKLQQGSEFKWSGYDMKEMSRRTIILALRCPKCGAAQIHRDGP